ncbi:MAG: PEGA domain-containing protein [Planctomycetota bacterium]|nr:MAG: PEGA domain-containing protein [Planctomycetota bacterium]
MLWLGDWNGDGRIARNGYGRGGMAGGANMTMRTRLIPALAVLIVAGGCVERTMRISTDPQGARVIVNDEEVGISPVKVSFLWYGDYEIIVRKRGYETVKTHAQVDPPWYQIPPIDFVAETLVIGTIHDDHVLPTIRMKPSATPPPEEVVARAEELRERTAFEAP